MAALDDDDRRYLTALLAPVTDHIEQLDLAVFGEDGRGGLTPEMAEARGFAKIGASVLGLVVGALGFLGLNMGQR